MRLSLDYSEIALGKALAQHEGDLTMIRNIKMLGAVALIVSGAFPVFAEVLTMTCGECMGPDAAGEKTPADEMIAWMDTSANSATIASLVGKYTDSATDGQWKPEELTIEVEGHCKDGNPTTGIFARLIKHS